MYNHKQSNLSLLTLRRYTKFSTYPAFTIVELLIVVVVIAILATLTIISFNGITKQAAAASLKSDLSSAIKQLEIAKVNDGSYPDDTTNLKKSSNTTYQYTKTDANTFCLSATDSTQGFHIDSTTRTIEDGVCSGHSEPGVPSGNWKAISVGRGTYFTCAISIADQAYCWGNRYSGAYGILGNNTYDGSHVPVPVYTSGVLSGLSIKTITTGNSHACVIASDNNAYCWGENGSQLGNNSVTSTTVPVAVYRSGALSGLSVKSISAGSDHTCVIASDDNVYCWGYNNYGQLGNNSITNSSVPTAIDKSGVLSGLTIRSVSVGNLHTCVIASDNNAYCWGRNNLAQLGNNTFSDSKVPVQVYRSGVLAGLTIKSISAGASTTCIIASNNKPYCWGFNNNGQLGNNSTSFSNIPVAVDVSGVLFGFNIDNIIANGNLGCAIASNNQAYCWGNNNYGQLGNNSTTESHTPVPIYTTGELTDLDIISISVGSWHSCLIAEGNNAYCWGFNNYGQLGNNTTTDSHVPIKVNSP